MDSFHPRICHYLNDGRGRDVYISNNNAGFYKEYRIINSGNRHVEPFKVNKFNQGYNPVFRKPVNVYFSDGQGRDMYIFHNNLRNANKTSVGLDLPSILRNDDIKMSSDKINSKINPNKNRLDIACEKRNRIITKNLLDRVFYGRAKIPERRMSPKVSFIKRILPTEYGDRYNTMSNFQEQDSSKIEKFSYSYNHKYIITEPSFSRSIEKISRYKPKIIRNLKFNRVFSSEK